MSAAPLYGEMERLCGLCDTPLPVGTYCPRCEEHVPTYEYPHGHKPVYATGRVA